MLQLPEIDQRGLPGAGLVRRAVAISLGAISALLLAAAVLSSTLTVNVVVDASGNLEPTRVWPVRARVQGAVGRVLVAEGDTVSAGQVLLRFDTLGTAEDLDRAVAQADEQQIEGARLAQSGQVQLAQASVSREQALARLLRTRAALKQRLVEYGFGSNVDSALAVYRPGTHVMLDAAVADLQSAGADIHAADLERTRAGLTALEAAKQRYAQRRAASDVAGRRRALARANVIAPASGVVLTSQPERLTGLAVREGDVMLELADVGAWRAELSVEEQDVRRVRIGDPATIDMAAIAPLRDAPVPGRVVAVAAEPQSMTAASLGPSGAGPSGSDVGPLSGGAGGSYRVTVSLDRAPVDSLGVGVLRRGYSVRAKLVTRRARVITLIRDWIRDQLRGRRS